ncbi:MAG: BolA family protein [Parahaliea sp.]
MNIQQEIESRLSAALQPALLEVVNESHMHSVPPNSSTHFRVVAVSEHFEGLRKVARHQCIYAALNELMSNPVHALALHLYTPAQWVERNGEHPDSPACMGGSKRDDKP